MFKHSSKGPERAATGAGQRDGAADDPAATSDGGGYLDASVTKAERSVKMPLAGLKAHAGGSSRDLTLAALITSPVRMPVAPGSPAIPNSPMPSTRMDYGSSTNLGPHPEGEGSYISGGEHHQRLFPQCGSGRNLIPPISNEGSSHGVTSSPFATAASASGRLGSPASHGHPHGHGHGHSHLSSSVSMQLPAPSKVPSPHAAGHGAFQKSLSNLATNQHAHAHVHASGNSSSQLLGRGDSTEDGPGHSGRLALPHLPTARQSEQQGSSPGLARQRGVASVSEVEAEGLDEGEEEEDEGPGAMLLGMNPSVPQAMRRRRWSLDDYQVVKRMYKGSTSAVYRAVCQRSGMTVALKVYFLNRVPINVVHMIRREIELHVPLAHRNVIMLYAAFQDEKHIVLVEEFAARGDLFGIHRSMNCRLAESQTSELILAPFLDALSYLHARGIMHRDIKPENILFTQDWVLKIAADYMAPEVERCPLKHAPEDNKDNTSLAYTTAIDIWSVGVLAYEMLVGFPPFVSNSAGDDGGGTRQGVAAFMAEQATRKSLRFPASVSAAAKDFIMATLAENPGDRPTAQQLLKHPWLFKMSRRMSVNSTSRFSNTNIVLPPQH
ncbi:hypothetical protein GPECTOR_50g618 [Gonium pectorale]|uniref:Protein kinase domain-containing protein n=1 Tax=Gonium pectorale TaxID=33097 RepID=A0A150G7K8_GONPE|nr:hypothetical protein GPECTOR_50g618 [Gonium pectorale]|eukprot:KXZ45824.1 hypothetical protein GPECTOR_50g618 [Gonium pectorale]